MMRKTMQKRIFLAAAALLIGSAAGAAVLEANALSGRQAICRTIDGGVNTPVERAVVQVRVDNADKMYTNMKDAWAAVDGREAVVTLLADVTTVVDVNTAFVLTGGKVTIDLNGHQWTYQYSSSAADRPASYDLIELRGDASLTVKGGSGSAMVYAGSSNSKGACLYATGNTTLTIEGGTFSSNVAAPIYVDGAALYIRGGVFRAAGASESAITMNNGTFNMTGGEVQTGYLTLNNTNGSQEVNIGGNSKLSGIATRGKNALGIEDTLMEGFRYQSKASGRAAVLTGNVARDVSTNESVIKSIEIKKGTADAPDTGSSTSMNLNYADVRGAKYKLYASAEVLHSVSENNVKWKWTISRNGTKVKEIDTVNKKGASPSGNYVLYESEISVSDGNMNVGEYVYQATVSALGSTVSGSNSIPETKSCNYTVNVTPIECTISENSALKYTTTYTYSGEAISDPVGNNFTFTAAASNNASNAQSVLNGLPKDDSTLKYEWYKGTKVSANRIPGKPTDAGEYILEVSTKEGANYHIRTPLKIEVTIAPKAVTPEFNAQSKVYDGNKEVKGAVITLKSGNNEITQPKGELEATAQFEYSDENAGDNKTILVKEVKLVGSKAANYKLADPPAGGVYSIPGKIEKAKLVMDIKLSEEKPEINKPVTITVTALNEDGKTPNTVLKAEDIQLSVTSVTGGTEAAPALKPSGNGVFTCEYTATAKGDKSFSADLVNKDSGNYVKNGQTGIGQVTFIAETIRSAVTVATDKKTLTYGGELTCTATVSKVDGKKGDALVGGLQLYLDSEESSSRIGSARAIKKSGDSVSIRLGRSQLPAGDHKIIAVFSSDLAEGSRAEASAKVEQIKLTWDTSELQASKTAGTSGEAKVYGTLKVEGMLDGEVKFTPPATMTTKGFKATEPGTYKVTVAAGEKEAWKFEPEAPVNYALPEGDPEISATVNAIKELSNPPAAKDGKSYKLLMEEGLSGVSEGLKRTSFNTPAKVEEELLRILTSSGTYSAESTEVYEVTLQVSPDGGKTWVNADANNFPAEGLVVMLPYPSGTGRYTHNFAVAHMFGESLFGHTSGTVEIPAVTKLDNGIQFRVTGLSPIAVTWTEGLGGSVANLAAPVSTAVRRLLGVQTGDDSQLLLYAGLGVGSVLALLTILVVILVRRKKED